MSIENQRLKQFSKAFTIATCRFRPTIARPSNSYIKTLARYHYSKTREPSIQLFIGINICNIVFHMHSSKFQQSYYDQLLCYSKSQLKWFWQDAHVQHFWTLAWYSIFMLQCLRWKGLLKKVHQRSWTPPCINVKEEPSPAIAEDGSMWKKVWSWSATKQHLSLLYQVLLSM